MLAPSGQINRPVHHINIVYVTHPVCSMIVQAPSAHHQPSRALWALSLSLSARRVASALPSYMCFYAEP